MKQNETEFEWTAKKERAAQYVADDRLSDETISNKLSIGRVTLWRWKEHIEFKERVKSIREEFRQRIMTEGIADRVNRLRRLDTDWKRLQQVIEDRAAETNRDVPGASTGMVVRREKETKFGTQVECEVDTGLLAELRNIEKQAAQELGQWVEKQENNQTGEPIVIKVLRGVSMDEL